MNWGFKFKNLRKVHKLLSIAVQSGPSRNQEIERSPSYISPVAGERREGAWRVWYRVPGFGFRFLDLIVSFVSDFELRISDFNSGVQ